MSDNEGPHQHEESDAESVVQTSRAVVVRAAPISFKMEAYLNALNDYVGNAKFRKLVTFEDYMQNMGFSADNKIATLRARSPKQVGFRATISLPPMVVSRSYNFPHGTGIYGRAHQTDWVQNMSKAKMQFTVCTKSYDKSQENAFGLDKYAVEAMKGLYLLNEQARQGAVASNNLRSKDVREELKKAEADAKKEKRPFTDEDRLCVKLMYYEANWKNLVLFHDDSKAEDVELDTSAVADILSDAGSSSMSLGSGSGAHAQEDAAAPSSSSSADGGDAEDMAPSQKRLRDLKLKIRARIDADLKHIEQKVTYVKLSHKIYKEFTREKPRAPTPLIRQFAIAAEMWRRNYMWNYDGFKIYHGEPAKLVDPDKRSIRSGDVVSARAEIMVSANGMGETAKYSYLTLNATLARIFHQAPQTAADATASSIGPGEADMVMASVEGLPEDTFIPVITSDDAQLNMISPGDNRRLLQMIKEKPGSNDTRLAHIAVNEVPVEQLPQLLAPVADI